MKPVIVIRPQPGSDATLAAARAMSLDAHAFPLLEVRPLPWEMPDPMEVDALLLGSANAVRHGGGALAVLVGKPVYAVGEKTAEAARAAGFEVIATGQGTLQQLLAQVLPGHRRLLRPVGRDRVKLTAPPGVSIDERTVYASEGIEMPDALADLLARPAVVLLHSAEAARQFAAACDKRGVDRANVSLAAISQRAAEAAGYGWGGLGIAETPDDAAMLALASQMCQDPRGEKDIKSGSMPEHSTVEAVPPVQGHFERARGQLLIALLAFVLGAALVAWMGWSGYLGRIVPESSEAQAAIQDGGEPGSAAAPTSSGRYNGQLSTISTVEGRLALLEERLSRLNVEASAASGNAGRAEGLLIAFAARRVIEKGQPLRYLADQLRLRFDSAQPRAVETIIDFAEAPVTIDELTARLEALGPQLTTGRHEESLWTSVSRELHELFVLRRDSSKVMTPEARIERARVMLTARRIPEAIDQVERLPGAGVADKWITDARRFAEAQAALDILETAAMLEPRKLKDSSGKRIDQLSPLATPAEAEPASKQD